MHLRPRRKLWWIMETRWHLEWRELWSSADLVLNNRFVFSVLQIMKLVGWRKREGGGGGGNDLARTRIRCVYDNNYYWRNNNCLFLVVLSSPVMSRLFNTGLHKTVVKSSPSDAQWGVGGWGGVISSVFPCYLPSFRSTSLSAWAPIASIVFRFRIVVTPTVRPMSFRWITRSYINSRLQLHGGWMLGWPWPFDLVMYDVWWFWSQTTISV